MERHAELDYACPVGAGAWDGLGRRSRSLTRVAEQDGG
jgi:hypothetical protein